MKKHPSLAHLRQLNRKLVEDRSYSPDDYLSTMTLMRANVEDPQLLAEIEIGLGGKYAQAGNPTLARPHLERGQAAYEALSENARDQWWVGVMHNRLGHVHMDLLNYEQSMRHDFLSIEANRSIGNDEAVKGGLLNIGIVLLKQGSHDESIEYIKQATDNAESYPVIQTLAFGYLGQAYLLADDFEHAIPYFDRSIRLATNPNHKLYFLEDAVTCLLAQGRAIEAQRWIDFSAPIDAHSQLDTYAEVALLISQGKVAAASKSHALAREHVAKAMTVAKAANNLQSIARVILAESEFELLDKNYRACETMLERMLMQPSPSDMLVRGNKLLLGLYEETGQWEKAYRLLQSIQATTQATQSRLRAIEQLIDSRQHQRELTQQNDQLVMLHAEKDELFRLVVHDMQNPLNVAMTTLELLMDHESYFSAEERLKRYARIRTAVVFSLDIIAQLTAMADVESHEEHASEERFAVDAVVAAVVTENVPLAEYKQQQLELGELASVVTQGNRVWLRRIVANLVSNAIKYSLPKATTTVALQADATHFKIIVTDEGLGFSEADLKQAFTKFAKLSAKPTGNESSSGLGLYILKTLTGKMGGGVSVVSDGKGKGSKFTVTLPIVHARQGVIANDMPAPPSSM